MDEPAKAHGLDGSLVKPDWPPLTLNEVRALLAKMPVAGDPIEIVSFSPRPFSAASVVRTRQGRIFVKRHARSVRDAEGLIEEHRFMQHLRANGVEVPRIFATSSGNTAIETGDWTYEVHEIPSGLDMYEDAISWTSFRSLDHARSAGQMLACLHLAAISYNAPPRKARPLVASFTIFASQDPQNALEQYLAAHPVLDQDAQTCRDCFDALDLLAPFHAEIKLLLPSLRPLWTHNDLHASNLFWSDASPRAHATSVIDFGLADRTNAICDIAQAIERNIVEWLVLIRDPDHGDEVPAHLDHLWAMLDGYEERRRLSHTEAAALAPMLALCHAEFALTEADYFLGVLQSPEKARVATRDYLVGHAQWFRGPGRLKIIEPLRQWAETRQTRAVSA
ncbi:MAG TPA: phosphotransferase [Terracidiphilus sp.]|nr:phosphotransferase [Terracidiphilus sp.]